MITIGLTALIFGILAGLYCFRDQTRSWIYMIIHTIGFSSKQGFYYLYDSADDRTTYEWFKSPSVRSYRGYQKLLTGARSSAYASFRAIYRYNFTRIIWRVVPFLCIAIPFLSDWHMYILGMLIICLVLFAYDFTRYGLRPGFYQRVVIYSILNGYIDTTRHD